MKTRLFWTIAHLIAWGVALIILIIPLYNINFALKPEYREPIKDLFTGEALTAKDLVIRFAICFVIVGFARHVIVVNEGGYGIGDWRGGDDFALFNILHRNPVDLTLTKKVGDDIFASVSGSVGGETFVEHNGYLISFVRLLAVCMPGILHAINWGGWDLAALAIIPAFFITSMWNRFHLGKFLAMLRSTLVACLIVYILFAKVGI